MTQELDEKGFVFLDDNRKPFRCCMQGDQPWLFYWHPSNRWVSLRKTTQSEILMFPHNLTEEEQELYNSIDEDNSK